MRKHSLAAQTHDCNLKAILTMLRSCLVNDWIVPESTSYCLFSFSPRGASASNDSKVIKLFASGGQPTTIGVQNRQLHHNQPCRHQCCICVVITITRPKSLNVQDGYTELMTTIIKILTFLL